MKDIAKKAIYFGEAIATEMTYPFTLPELLAYTAQMHPQRGITFIDELGKQQRISYSTLLTEAHGYLDGLRSSGLKRGDQVVIQLSDNYAFIIIFWACILGGFVPVLLNVSDNFEFPNSDNQALLNVLKLMPGAVVFTNALLKGYLAAFLSKHDANHNLIVFEELAKGKETVASTEVDAAEDAVILFSSGSTGMPKGIRLTHGNIVNMEKATVQINGFHANDVSLNWMPLEHVGGIVMFHIRDVYCGAEQIIIRKDYILAKPLRWIEAISNYKATVTWAPNFAFSLINKAFSQNHTVSEWDLTSMRFILNGGEAINAATARTFLNLLSPYGLSDDCIFPSWGMSETSSGTVYAHRFNSNTGVYGLEKYNYGEVVKQGLSTENGTQFVCLGRPIPGAAIRIVNSEGEIVKENVVARIQIKGKNVTPGYYKNDEVNRQAFTVDNWFDTGDIGFLRDNELTITGRLKEVVIVNGKNYNASEIEYIVESIRGVIPSYTAAVSVRKQNADTDELIVFYCSETTDPENLYVQTQQIQSQLLATLRLRASNIIPINKEEVGKTSIGKIKRVELASRYLNGMYDKRIKRIHEYSTYQKEVRRDEEVLTATQQKLVDISIEIIGISTLKIQDSFFETGGNSIDVIRLTAEVNRSFEVDISIGEVFALQTLEKIAESIERRERKTMPPISRTGKKKHYAVSSAQKRMLLVHEMDGVGCAYNNVTMVRFEGELDTVRLESAFRRLIQKYDILRTSFHFQYGEYVQKVHESVSIKLEIVKLQAHESMDSTHWLGQFVRPFQLDKPELMRCMLVQSHENQFLLLVDLHHIITDGISQVLLLNEVFDIYDKDTALVPLVQYRDFAEWEQGILYSEHMLPKEEFWLSMHASLASELNLPYDYKRGELQSFNGNALTQRIPEHLTVILRKRAQEVGTTAFTLLFMTFKLLMAKYSGNDDLIVGTLVNGRTKAETETMLGLFANILPIKSYPNKLKPINAYLNEMKDLLIQALSHHEYPFEKLVHKLDFVNQVNRNPMFDTMFIYQNFNSDIKIGTESGLKFVSHNSLMVGSKVDLTLYGIERKSQIELVLEYNEALFKKTTAQRFLNHYLQILTQVLDNSESIIGSIKLTDEITSRLTSDAVLPSAYPMSKTIHELFWERAERTPQYPAVSFEGVQWSFAELQAYSTAIALRLREMNVGRNNIVAILLKRSSDMVSAMMGIIGAGAAFLPIDRELPKERIQYMLQDSQASVIITTSEMLIHRELAGVKVLDLSTVRYEIPAASITNINNPDDSIYVYYTSGSTGRPKGVVVSHKAVNNFIHGFSKQLQIEEGNKILSITTVSFDIIIVETFLALVFGVHIFMTSQTVQKDVNEIARLTKKHHIDILQITPSRLQLLLKNEANKESLKQLKKLIVGGEAFSKSLLRTLGDLNHTEVYNVYGPTEATVWTTVKKLEPDSELSIGFPIDNTEIYILDENLNMQPIGIPGNIYISGDGLAKSYLNQPELTDSLFVQNPFRSGQKMYASGDRGKWLENGEIVCLGRSDNQVKIRGFRIELDEIKSLLLQANFVNDAVAVVLGKGENASLGLYFISEANASIVDMEQYLKRKLPAYMVPQHFVQVEHMPLTLSGKIDIKALPEPAEQKKRVSNVVEVSKTQLQQFLVDMWEDILGVNPVGIRDHFFELGGNSFKGTIFIYRLRDTIGKLLPLSMVYKHPTIEAISQELERVVSNTMESIQPVQQQEWYPLSFEQRMIYGASSFDDSNLTYNLPVVFAVKGYVDIAKMKRAIETVVRRHSIFQTYFEWWEGRVVQKIDPDVCFEVHLQHHEFWKQEDIIASFIKPFDLNAAPLVRSEIHFANSEVLIMLDAHHIVLDGVSLKILFDEINTVYEGNVLSRVRLQYVDYCCWVTEKFPYNQKDEDYWLSQFADTIPQLELQTDYVRPHERQFYAGSISVNLEQDWLMKLNRSLSHHNQTLFVGLVSALYLLLYTYSGQRDIVIGTPVTSRPHNDLEKVVGMFTNTLALRQKIEDDMTVNQLLKVVNQNLIEAFDHQNYPFLKLLDKLGYKNNLSRSPLFDVMLVLQDFEFEGIHIEGNEVCYVQPQLQRAQFDLVFNVQPHTSGLSLTVNYASTLWKQESIAELVESYIEALKFIVTEDENSIVAYRPVGKVLKQRMETYHSIDFQF
ncbi:non-ribosomal peptide synthetase [Paenibacillus sp. FSL H7-689]|uniref:non-ribosomal peptide synthetase n=1 Tax=Paenibacillus sp. FSL H7-689 TaxID=1227349 RepID=UPI0003E2AB86|nr:non-ribosomal peptide synthetase [Paenibacillus sp. FSL H7-689]ETT44840.1 amino acid adenylation domain-containing protein [Paenibacillus sp. FSL H7-689]